MARRPAAERVDVGVDFFGELLQSRAVVLVDGEDFILVFRLERGAGARVFGDARGDFTIIVDPESETLEILETAQKADTLVYIYYRPDGTGASKPQEKIPAYITGLSYSASVDGRVEAAVTFVAGGNVDSTAQAGV